MIVMITDDSRHNDMIAFGDDIRRELDIRCV